MTEATRPDRARSRFTLRATEAEAAPDTGGPVPAAVEARSFGFAYGSTDVLRDLTLAIPRRSITAIIGPSGCGKSTLLRAINRLDALVPAARHRGELLVDGASVYAPGVDLGALRRRVGMVFQRPNPFPLSIFANVAWGAKCNNLVPARDLHDLVERCLRRAALWDEVKDRLEAPALALSGGQQQRLCIARALGTSPGLLLLDEPCTALDPVATSRIEELLVELKRDFTIVLVTHNMQQAARVADWTGFIDEGELVEFDTTRRLFTTPAHERTEAYITGRFG